MVMGGATRRATSVHRVSSEGPSTEEQAAGAAQSAADSVRIADDDHFAESGACTRRRLRERPAVWPLTGECSTC